MNRFSSPNLRAALWAWRTAGRLRRATKQRGLDAVVALPKVPDVPSTAERGVRAILRRRGETCLVRAKVLQSFRLAHGDKADLIIGVTAPSKGFRAHAWLEGDPPCHDEGFTELLRRSARS